MLDYQGPREITGSLWKGAAGQSQKEADDGSGRGDVRKGLEPELSLGTAMARKGSPQSLQRSTAPQTH